jgi:hypothetical protein
MTSTSLLMWIQDLEDACRILLSMVPGKANRGTVEDIGRGASKEPHAWPALHRIGSLPGGSMAFRRYSLPFSFRLLLGGFSNLALFHREWLRLFFDRRIPPNHVQVERGDQFEVGTTTIPNPWGFARRRRDQMQD